MTGIAVAGALLASAGPVAAAGAIALGQCGAYGYAYDKETLADAEAAALKTCGKACRLVATMRQACGALAVDMKNTCGAHGYAVGARLGRAQNAALRQCYRHGGKDCVIRAFACDARL